MFFLGWEYGQRRIHLLLEQLDKKGEFLKTLLRRPPGERISIKRMTFFRYFLRKTAEPAGYHYDYLLRKP